MRATNSTARMWCGVVVLTLAACGTTPTAEPQRETARDAEVPRVESSSLSDSDAREELDRLQARSRSIDKQNAALRRELDLLQEEQSRLWETLAKHERPPLERRAGDPPGTILGVVQACNNDEEIVIVSIGKRDSVSEGAEFAVTRAGSHVATIVIDKAFPNYSIVTFKPGTPKTPIQSGDVCVGRARTDLPK